MITLPFNSNNRMNGTNSDFDIYFDIDVTKSYDKIALNNLWVPKSYYNVPTSSSFTLREGSTDTSVPVAEGNYTRRSLQNYLPAILNTYSTTGATFSINYNNTSVQPDTGKYAFQTSATISVSFVFTTSMNQQLGFDSNSTNTFSGGSLTSTNVVNLLGEQTLFLRSNAIQNSRSDVLQVLLGQGIPNFSGIYFQNPDVFYNSRDFVLPSSNVFHFTLTSEDGELINLNGQNIVGSITLFNTEYVSRVLSRKLGDIEEVIRKGILLNETRDTPKE